MLADGLTDTMDIVRVGLGVVVHVAVVKVHVVCLRTIAWNLGTRPIVVGLETTPKYSFRLNSDDLLSLGRLTILSRSGRWHSSFHTRQSFDR